MTTLVFSNAPYHALLVEKNEAKDVFSTYGKRIKGQKPI